MSIARSNGRAVFFDRDGTLNVDVHYLHLPEDFIWTPGARDAIKLCNDMGYMVVVITNQSGVARGYYPESDVVALHQWMNRQLERIGARIYAFYYCPHYPAGKIAKYAVECSCRKPSPELLVKAGDELGIDLGASYMIGDSDSDMECAANAGVKAVRYQPGSSLLELLKENICKCM